jgi:hypothetical protein
MSMPRGIRDLVGVIAALAIIGVALIAMNGPLQQGAGGRLFGHIDDLRSTRPVAELSDAVVSALGVVTTFSADNTLLFAFLIVAAVLVVLMLRT